MVLVVTAFILTGLYFTFNPQEPTTEEVALSTLIDQIDAGEVKEIQVAGSKINFTLNEERPSEEEFEFYTIKESRATLNETLATANPDQLKKIKLNVLDTQNSNFWRDVMVSLIPFALIIVFFLFMMRQAQGANSQAMSFGKSKARLAEDSKKKTKFKDVAGADEAKEELEEVVDFLKKPTKYTKMGAKIPRGVMLVGPPGCGKTLMARAVAGEANVPFFNISGSEFVEMFVGVGASRVRDLFKKAKRNAPCIIFIDEIDAVGRQRGAGLGGGHDEREQTLNQILTEMDGFEKETNVIIIAATNRPDVLDPALLRPGRFDRRVVVNRPDLKAREQILAVHTRNKPLEKSVNLKSLAKQTPGFSGADLENLMNEAAIMAAKKNQKTITQQDAESAIEKVVMGPERKNKIMSEEERRITAYHEVGHALAGHFSPKCDPVHKISIVSRGMALGVTWFLPQADKVMQSKSKFTDELNSLLGGFVAEELIFGEMTTGASNDLQKASNLARKMVTEYGMSRLGPIIYGEPQREVFLGRDYGHKRNYSEELASQIDREVEKIIKNAYKGATDILKKHNKLLHQIAEALLEKETLTQEEFLNFLPKSTWKLSEIKEVEKEKKKKKKRVTKKAA